MSALTINSIEIPVAADSVRETELEMADKGRGLNGAYLGSRIEYYVKRVWSGRIITVTEANAWAYRQMINGGGYGFSFASDLRDDWKGNQGWSTTNASRQSGGKYSAGLMRITTGNTSKFTFPTGFPSLRWTISLWSLESGTWYHYVKVYGTATVWKDGTGGVAQPAWLTSDSTGITLAGDAGAAHDYSEIVIHNFKWPSTWPALVYARNAAMVKPPFVGAGGTITGYGEDPGANEYTCRGAATTTNLKNRGSSAAMQEIDFVLEEK